MLEDVSLALIFMHSLLHNIQWRQSTSISFQTQMSVAGHKSVVMCSIKLIVFAKIEFYSFFSNGVLVSWQRIWSHTNSIFNQIFEVGRYFYEESRIKEIINCVLPIPLYYISINIYIVNDILTNLMHATTKTTRCIMATVLDNPLTAMYAVGSISVNIKWWNYYKVVLSKFYF